MNDRRVPRPRPSWQRRQSTAGWDGPRPMGAGVERVMKHLKAPTTEVVTSVFSDWETVAGELIGKHTRPSKIVDGVLHLETDEPAWASEMRWMSEELLRRIQEHLGNNEIKEIVVHVSR